MLKVKIEKVENITKLLTNLNPENILSRGYSITTHRGKAITNTSKVNEKDVLITYLSKGQISSKVEKIVTKGDI